MQFSLTAILVSHFMLDLHEARRVLARQGSDLPTIQIMSLDIGQPHSEDPEPQQPEDQPSSSNPAMSHTELEGRSESGVSIFPSSYQY